MWILVLLLNLLGRKNFLRFLAGWMLIMLFFLYCFVHDAFDQPRPSQRGMVQHMERPACKACVSVHPRALTPAFDCCQRLLDGPLHVVVLPPLVPFMRQIARPDRGINLLCAGAVRQSIDGVSKIDSRSISAVAAVRAEHVNALQILGADQLLLSDVASNCSRSACRRSRSLFTPAKNRSASG